MQKTEKTTHTKMGNVASAAASSGHSGGPPAAGSLSEAAANGDTAAIASILSSAGKDAADAARLVNAADADGWTSVHFATYGGSAPALSLLLAAGGDASRQDKGGRAPLSLAALRGNLACAAALLKSGDKKAGGAGGASLLGARDAHGMQAAHKAAVAGHAPMLELLLKLGADPDAAANDGSTPAHMAAYKGHVDALRALLVESPGKRRAGNALARRRDGLSVLAEAAAQGREAAVAFLLSLPGVRSSVAEADGSGRTAMDLAAARGHSGVVAELRRAAGLPPAASEASSSALAPAAASSAPGGGAYPSLFQGAPAAGSEQPVAPSPQSWWQQAVSAATAGVAGPGASSAPAAAPAGAAVDPRAAAEWWQSAIGREPSELAPPPAAALVVGDRKEGGGGGLLDDREAFEAAALAKAQGLFRALAGKRAPAAAAAAGASAAASAAAAASPSSSRSKQQPAAREEKYDLEPYDSDDYEEEAPVGADAEGEPFEMFLFVLLGEERKWARGGGTETSHSFPLTSRAPHAAATTTDINNRRAPPPRPHRPGARRHRLQARAAGARRGRRPRLGPRRPGGRRRHGRPRRRGRPGPSGGRGRLPAAAARRRRLRRPAGPLPAARAPGREDAAGVRLPDHAPGDARPRRRRRRPQLRARRRRGLSESRQRDVPRDRREAGAPGADAERGAGERDRPVHERVSAEVLRGPGLAEPQAPPAAAAGAGVRVSSLSTLFPPQVSYSSSSSRAADSPQVFGAEGDGAAGDKERKKGGVGARARDEREFSFFSREGGGEREEMMRQKRVLIWIWILVRAESAPRPIARLCASVCAARLAARV